MVSIWFFVGVLLLIYGVLIHAAGIYGLSHPPDVKLAGLHAEIWWGDLLIAMGAFYSIRFFPGRGK
jgi:hypothetical protein